MSPRVNSPPYDTPTPRTPRTSAGEGITTTTATTPRPQDPQYLTGRRRDTDSNNNSTPEALGIPQGQLDVTTVDTGQALQSPGPVCGWAPCVLVVLTITGAYNPTRLKQVSRVMHIFFGWTCQRTWSFLCSAPANVSELHHAFKD